MIRELDRVVLTKPLKNLHLEAGDVVTVVLVHDGGRGYEVEFVTLDGETHAVTTVMAGDIRLIPSRRAAARPGHGPP